MLADRDKDAAMSDSIAAEMRGIVRGAAEPCPAGDSVKAAISRAARRLGLGYRRTRSFWYGSSVAVRAAEADKLRALELQILAERKTRLERDLAAIGARLQAKDRQHVSLDKPHLGVDRRAQADRRAADIGRTAVGGPEDGPGCRVA